MRHPLIKLAAAVFIVALTMGLGQANAEPRPNLNGLTEQTSPVENVHYYGRRYYGGWYPWYGYRPYYRPYYYQPYRYGYYGYRPYARYGYRRHWRRW